MDWGSGPHVGSAPLRIPEASATCQTGRAHSACGGRESFRQKKRMLERPVWQGPWSPIPDAPGFGGREVAQAVASPDEVG